MKCAMSKDAKLEVDLGIYKAPLIPTRKNPTDAGLDLYSFGDYTINPHSFKIIRTGLCFEFPENVGVLLKPKSRCDFLLGAGVVDQNYRGEILVKIFNVLDSIINIKHGDGICQMLIIPVFSPYVEIVDSIFDGTDRGITGGIASQQLLENLENYE